MKTPCQTDPEMWVADTAASRAEAARLCRDCHRIFECFTEAVTTGKVYGVWGGTDFSKPGPRKGRAA
jgi:WhiB family redox-sensing transcriptional regulator